MCVEFRICCADAAANGFYDRHGYAVSSLLVCLRIGVDGEDLINLILAEPLQAKTLPRHQPSDSAAAQDNAVCVCCVHRMGNARKHTPAARIAAREAEINGIAFMRFLVAFLRCFLNVENARILPFEVGKGAVLPGIQAAGVWRDLRIAFGQIHKIKARVSPTAALRCGQGAGESVCVVDPGPVAAWGDLYKSFCICSKDRKYFSGASGIKISDKEQPPS